MALPSLNRLIQKIAHSPPINLVLAHARLLSLTKEEARAIRAGAVVDSSRRWRQGYKRPDREVGLRDAAKTQRSGG